MFQKNVQNKIDRISYSPYRALGIYLGMLILHFFCNMRAEVV